MSGADFRPVSVAILIPTRGRATLFAKTLQRMPFLNDPHTFVGIERKEMDAYHQVINIYSRIRYILYSNPEGSVAVARNNLRLAALKQGYDWYVATDDNARFNQYAVNALVQSAEAWRVRKGKRVVFMAGMHGTAAHFDRNLIQKKETVGGWTTYPGVAFIFHAVPHAWYSRYEYPPSCFALEDRHMMLAAIRDGHRDFRICMDAPFTKSRYQSGGQGDINKRRWNCGRAIEQLAHDFPDDVGTSGTLRLPWQQIIAFRDGATADRLVGGAMRKGDDIVRVTRHGPRMKARLVGK